MREAMSGPFEDLVEVVQFAEIDQHAAGRELVEAEAFRPARAASVAAVRPAGPAPMTMTS